MQMHLIQLQVLSISVTHESVELVHHSIPLLTLCLLTHHLIHHLILSLSRLKPQIQVHLSVNTSGLNCVSFVQCGQPLHNALLFEHASVDVLDSSNHKLCVQSLC